MRLARLEDFWTWNTHSFSPSQFPAIFTNEMDINGCKQGKGGLDLCSLVGAGFGVCLGHEWAKAAEVA